jgi:hypothetical protein
MSGAGQRYLRFDSVTALLRHCREEFASADVTAGLDQGELRLCVVERGRLSFSALIVHLEGERTYLVRLPARQAA